MKTGQNTYRVEWKDTTLDADWVIPFPIYLPLHENPQVSSTVVLSAQIPDTRACTERWKTQRGLQKYQIGRTSRVLQSNLLLKTGLSPRTDQMSHNPKTSKKGHPEPLWIHYMFQNCTAFLLKELLWIAKQNLPSCNLLSLPLVVSSVTTMFSFIIFTEEGSYQIAP